MKPKSVFASCIVVVITLLSTSAAATAEDCPVEPPVNAPCTSRDNLGVPCGCNGQLICLPLLGGWPPCEPYYRVEGVWAGLPVLPALGVFWCKPGGYSLEPTTNSTVTVPTQSPDEPVWGFADIHEHQFANMAYGGTVLWGSVFDEDGVNDALEWCDFTKDFRVMFPNYYIGNYNIEEIVLYYEYHVVYDWGWPIHGNIYPSSMPPFVPTQEIYGLTVLAATGEWHTMGGTGPFDGWPTYLDGGHQQMYHKWVERAYEGGLRLLVNLMVHNEILCELSYRRERYKCDDMPTVDRQIDRVYALQTHIDDQCGAPGCGWYRVVTSPQQARQVIRDGKMAVIIGIEVDFLFGYKPDQAPTLQALQKKISHYKGRGVRYLFPVHMFDNAWTGGALYEFLYAFANSFTTGEAVQTWDCYDEGYRFQLPAIADIPRVVRDLYLLLEGLTGIDLPDWNEDHRAHCNALGLTEHGKILLDELIKEDMIIDVDHLSHRAMEGIPTGAGEIEGSIGALRIFEDRFEDPDNRRGYKYPVVSGHSVVVADWDSENPTENRIPTEYHHTVSRIKRIRDLGGIVAANVFRGDCNDTREWLYGDGEGKGYLDLLAIMKGDSDDDVPFYGEGYPSIAMSVDMGCFNDQVGPRFGPHAAGCAASTVPRLEYPFQAFDESGEFCPQQTGDRVFDFNEQGLAHYGLVPDLLADARVHLNPSGSDVPAMPPELEPLFNSAETFIRMWERIENCTPDETPPELTIPGDVEVKCPEPTDPPFTGTATAWDFCDRDPIVTYEDDVSVGKCPTIIKRTWKATDDSDNETTDVQTITVVNTMPDLTFEVLPSGLPVDTCFEVNEKVMVHVRMGPANSGIVAAQFSLQYDPSVLAFNTIIPGSAVDPMSPFTFEFDEMVDEATGTIFYAVGVNPFGGVGTQGPATLAGINFTTISDCNQFDIRCFDRNPRAAFTNTNGARCACGDCFDTGTFYVDGSLPKLECPVSVHRNPDCDGPTALVTWDPPAATQSCAGHLPVECTAVHDGGEDITHLINGGGEFPQGTSAFTCSATNSCGATDSCTWEVTVTPYHTVDLTVQLSPIISGDVERCIKFELFSDCTTPPLVINHDIFFGGLFDHVGHFTDIIKIPDAGQWRCITARDQLHTLRSCAWLECVDGVYYAVFKGDPFFDGGNWLQGGNLDGFKKENPYASHDVIDILDFGMFVSQYLRVVNPNTPCIPQGPHADINGDGVVDALDFTFVMMNFLDHSKDCCCPDTTAGTIVGHTEISVRELREMGLGELAVSDLNRDGLLNMDDIQAFQAGELQPTKGSRDRAGMSR